jgi:uncharacterized protein YlxP (DUF503 family)
MDAAAPLEGTMVVGVGVIRFRIHDCRSLKGKRGVVRSIIRRIQNQFNISIAEVGLNDVHQRAEIGFALVGNDSRVINTKLDKVFNLADELGLAEMLETDMEILHL